MSFAPGSGLWPTVAFQPPNYSGRSVGVQNRATIRQVGKQVPLVIVQAEYTFVMLHSVHLKKIVRCAIMHIQIKIIRRTWWSLEPIRRLTTLVRAPALYIHT